MKLGKKSILIIGIGAFVIALTGLWLVYSQQAAQKEELASTLDTAKLKLTGINNKTLSRRRAELEWQLEQVSSQADAARETFARPVDSISVNDHLFEIAAAHSVNITAISSTGPAEEELAGLVLPVLPFSITATGNMTDLSDFITRLNDDYPTCLIRTAGMDIPENGEPATADIEVAIYTYQGDSDG